MAELFIPPSGITTVGTSGLVLRHKVESGLIILGTLDSIIHTMYDRYFFPQDKFVRIGLLFLYGIKTDLKARYERIDKKYKDLPISVELDTSIMEWAELYDLELMKEIFMIATCEAVLDVLRKYKLPTEPIEKVRAQYTTIPETIEECEQKLKEKTGEVPADRYGIPDQRLPLYLEQEPELARKAFINILNKREMYEVLKKRIHLIPASVIESLIEMTLSRSSFHQEQCEELKKLLKK